MDDSNVCLVTLLADLLVKWKDLTMLHRFSEPLCQCLPMFAIVPSIFAIICQLDQGHVL